MATLARTALRITACRHQILRPCFGMAQRHGRTPARTARLSVLAQAKANKPKKGGKQQKTSALDKLIKAKEESEAQGGELAESGSEHKTPDVMMLLLVLTNSYWQSTKKYLMEDVDFEQLADELFKAPFGLLVTDKYDNDDPIITYANKAALGLWETSWTGLVGTNASKYAVDAQDAFLTPAAPEGAPPAAQRSSKYNGWLTTGEGSKIKIRDGRLFDVSSPGGELLGQALKFDEVETEGGQIIRLRETVTEEGSSTSSAGDGAVQAVPTQEEVDALQAAVQSQADLVRELKEGKGLTNQDDEVKEAVAKLLALKEQTATMQKQLKASR